MRLETGDRRELEELVARPDGDRLEQRRARILLLADSAHGKGLGSEEIQARLGIGEALVRNTCRRLVEKGLASALKRPRREPLAAPPLVVRPADRSATLAFLAADEPVDLHVSWGDRGLEPEPLAPGEARSVDLDLPDGASSVSYRVEARTPTQEKTYRGRIVPARPPGASFRFAVLADVHLPIFAPQHWMDGRSGPLGALMRFGKARSGVAEIFRRTLKSVRELEVDFVVSLGDLLHVAADAPDPRFPTPDFRAAYRDLRGLVAATGVDTPFFTVLGNWDGESGWLPERLRTESRKVRTAFFPQPSERPYFSWTWGDALFVVLDVTGFTPEAPSLDAAEHAWTLGPRQLEWLRTTLESSDRRIKMLFMHHPVGGRGGDGRNTAYARGGGRAARAGEQARVHELARRHGVQVVFHGHDHVFVDMEVDGVRYTLPGSAGAPWKLTAEATGYESFDRRSGFATVEVSPEALQVDFRDVEGEVFGGYALSVDD